MRGYIRVEIIAHLRCQNPRTRMCVSSNSTFDFLNLQKICLVGKTSGKSENRGIRNMSLECGYSFVYSCAFVCARRKFTQINETGSECGEKSRKTRSSQKSKRWTDIEKEVKKN